MADTIKDIVKITPEEAGWARAPEADTPGKVAYRMGDMVMRLPVGAPLVFHREPSS